MALHVTLFGWAVFEAGVRVRDRLQGRGGRAHDRGTRILIAVTLGPAVVFAALAASHHAVRPAGLVVAWCGLALRIWAIVALGSAFRTTVEVDADQAVVTRGPYRWVRHPSYSGLLLIVVGSGLASGSWLALIFCAVLPLPAVLWRIEVEERELTRVLGDRYRAYEQTTKRLIPGVW